MNHTNEKIKMTDQEIEDFVGNNVIYYKEKWSRNVGSDLSRGWNGVAFFFFPEWAAYRKMYKEVLLVFLGLIIINIFFVLLPFDTDLASEFVGQLLKIVLSAIANGLYYKKAIKIISRSRDMDDQDKTKYLKQKGGTSMISLILCIIAELLIASIPYILSYLLYITYYGNR